MKKFVLVTALWLVSAGLIFAQGGKGLEKVKRITQDEVPAIVQFSLQNEFDLAPGSGNWSLKYSKSATGAGNGVLFQPIAYIFQQKREGNKVEIHYSPSGALQRSRGIEKPDEVAGKE